MLEDTVDAVEQLAARYLDHTCRSRGESRAQSTGAHDAYQTADRVTYEGVTWTSTVDANVWEPGVYGWEQLT